MIRTEYGNKLIFYYVWFSLHSFLPSYVCFGSISDHNNLLFFYFTKILLFWQSSPNQCQLYLIISFRVWINSIWIVAYLSRLCSTINIIIHGQEWCIPQILDSSKRAIHFYFIQKILLQNLNILGWKAKSYCLSAYDVLTYNDKICVCVWNVHVLNITGETDSVEYV